MKELTSEADIIFVDYQFTWKDIFVGILKPQSQIPWKQILGLKKRITIESNVTIYTPPPIFPSFWIKNEKLFDFINQINQKIVLKSIYSFVKKKDITITSILTAFNPFLGLGVSEIFPNTPHYYYCYDEINEAHWLKTHGGRLEKLLMPQVNGCIFTSEKLKEIKGHYSKNSFIVKNGVNTTIFKPYAKHAPSNNSIIKIGYLGSIDDRLDTELIIKSAEICPNVQFHFVGRVVHENTKNNLNHSSIFFEKAVPIEDVPKKMREFDIGIIPYLKNKFTQAIYPLKINEYLAIGLPVIMTSFAKLDEFSSMVIIADSADSFKKSVDNIILTDNKNLIRERTTFAENNSWKNRSKLLYQILFSNLNDDK
ncbi:glycosyltransferase [Mongoliitalea lutea]|nr:glycosyltransferase [Mongoliitalea lutea]